MKFQNVHRLWEPQPSETQLALNMIQVIEFTKAIIFFKFLAAYFIVLSQLS